MPIDNKKIDRLVVVAEIEGKCYSILVTKETQEAILTLIELTEGGIKVLDEAIEGIVIQDPFKVLFAKDDEEN